MKSNIIELVLMLNISKTFWHHPQTVKKTKTPENDISCLRFSVINEIEIQKKKKSVMEIESHIQTVAAKKYFKYQSNKI